MRAKLVRKIVGIAIVVIATVIALAIWRSEVDEREHADAPPRKKANASSAQTDNAARRPNEQAPEKNSSLGEAVLAAAEKETDPAVRESVIQDFVSSLDVGQIPSAISQLGESDLAREIKIQLIRKWAAADPNAAAGWAQHQSLAGDRQSLINTIATVWADRDLAAASAWVHQLDGELREGALLKVAYEAVDTDLNKALELAREVSGDAARADLVEHIAAEWAAKQPKQIADWAMQIQDANVRDRISVGIAASWAESDPAVAATFAVQSIGAGKPQEDAIISVVQRWSQSKPNEAAGWVTQFPEGRLRDIAAVEVVKGWWRQNAGDAQRWVEGLSSGTMRDAVTHALDEIKTSGGSGAVVER